METFPQIIAVNNQQKGLIVAKDLLYKMVNDKTLLLLSGGSTPKDLYKTLAKERKLNAKAVGMVDERADGSNERMIEETGLLFYIKEKKIPFYSILRLHPKGVASDFAKDYDEKIQYSLKHISRGIAVMGIGEDGHTAGIPARTQNSKLKTQNYVAMIGDFPGEFRQRITLTFKALSKMDLLIVLAFGENKKEALRKMFEKGTLSEIPARFYIKPEIAKKTILITDQKI